MHALQALLLTTALAANDPPPDGWLTAKSKLTLITHRQLEGSRVHVDTNDGVVTLYGRVKDVSQKQAAEKAVREIEGVRAVKNLLQIVPSSLERTVARADADIKEQADQLLSEDPALDDSRIKVRSVDRGVVLLSGHARTFSDRLRAVADVDQLTGVRRVVSEIAGPEAYGEDERNLTFSRELRMEARDSLTDTRITADVKMKLLGAAGVPGVDINVDTRDGVVTLFGSVPDDVAKGRAEAETAEVAGVLRVKNQLEIVTRAAAKGVEQKDADIRKELKKQLAARPAFKDLELEVSNGSVRLTGTVADTWEKLQVMRLVRKAKGVKELHEEIDVRPREKRQF